MTTTLELVPPAPVDLSAVRDEREDDGRTTTSDDQGAEEQIPQISARFDDSGIDDILA